MGGRSEDGLEDRRQFTVEMALALLGGAAITIACGGGASPGAPSGPATPTPRLPTPTPPPADARIGVIGNNHGHEALITGAQLLAGEALRLEIVGAAPHGHEVELSADEVVQIRGGATVTKLSSETGGLFGLHAHDIRFN